MNGYSHPLSWWLANDIVLALGQRGEIVDLGWYKLGDGNNAFSGLTLLGLDNTNVWFSYWGPQKNKAALLTTLYHSTLIGGTLIQEGGFVEFEYIIIPANNSNVKNVYLKFATETLITVSVPINSSVPIIISGTIKLTDYAGLKGYFKLKAVSNGTMQVSAGELTGINWNANNLLIIQGQGVANNDIVSQGGEGKICIVSRF